jgi:hypothetical protein
VRRIDSSRIIPVFRKPLPPVPAPISSAHWVDPRLVDLAGDVTAGFFERFAGLDETLETRQDQLKKPAFNIAM